MARQILIVDDEPNILRSLQFLMLAQGYAVALARDGEEALARAAATRPDLVLLDVMLPGLDGFEVCRRLRAAFRDRPRIVMLTARGREPERLQGADAGADAYVTKPFSTRDLVALVGELLGAGA